MSWGQGDDLGPRGNREEKQSPEKLTELWVLGREMQTHCPWVLSHR